MENKIRTLLALHSKEIEDLQARLDKQYDIIRFLLTSLDQDMDKKEFLTKYLEKIG